MIRRRGHTVSLLPENFKVVRDATCMILNGAESLATLPNLGPTVDLSEDTMAGECGGISTV